MVLALSASSLYGRYLEPLGSGLRWFLVLCVLLGVPWVLWQYRRHGRVDPRAAVVSASFVLFLACAWAMVLVPFPDRDTICALRHVDAQLVPFRWVQDMLREADREGTGLSGLVTNGPFVVRVLNVLLLLPLGVYLRRWWGAGLARTTVIALLLSLAFEVTQWTGVWGVYPCAYRTFDVDDLISNTAGAMLGWAVAPAVVLLPQRRTLLTLPDVFVSVPRRLLSAALDYVMAALVGGLAWGIGAGLGWLPPASGTWARAALLLGLVLVGVAMPLLRGATPGQRLLGLAQTGTGGAAPSATGIVVRASLVWAPVVVALGIGDLASDGDPVSLPAVLALVAWLAWAGLLIASVVLHPARQGLQDRASGTRLVLAGPRRHEEPHGHDAVAAAAAPD